MSPTRRLLLLAGAWTGLALLALVVPVPGALLAASALAVVAAAGLDLVHGLREPAVDAVRRLPERATRGGVARVAIELHNAAPRPVLVDVYEAVPDDLAPTATAFPGTRLPPGGRRHVAYELHPARRGDRALGPLTVFTTSRLGLLRRRAFRARGDVVRVAPPLAHLVSREGLEARRLAREGARPARRRGQGFEFESLRDYVPGDDSRRLDWAASARRGRPVVRLTQHERNHVVLLALDASRLMAARVGGRSKLDHTVDAALVLAHAALASGDRVGLCAFDRTLRGWLAPRRHRRGIGPMVDFLRPLEPALVEADFEALARGIGARQRQRALVVVFTDFVESDASRLRGALGVLGRRHAVLLAAVRDPLYAELDARAPLPAADDHALLRRVALADLLVQRETEMVALRRLGLDALDLAPRELTARVLNRYLAARYGLGR